MKTILVLLFAILVGCGSSTPDNGTNGPGGEIGPNGLKGEKGDKGDPGPPGLNGSAANRGDPGPQGATGSQGPSGPAGAPGVAGKDATEPVFVAGARLKPEYFTYKYTASDGASYTIPVQPSGSWYDTGRNERCQYYATPTPGATIQDGKPRCLPIATLVVYPYPSYNPNDYVEMAVTTIVYSH